MTEYMHLVGAEDVRAAASTMSSAAESISRSSSSIAEALDHDRRLRDEQLEREHNRREEALDRFAAIVVRQELLVARLERLQELKAHDASMGV